MTLRERLAAALARPAAGLDLLPGDDPDGAGETSGVPGPAAVLAAVVDRPEPTLLLTQRPEFMRHHAGQVAFPGGRVDPDDAGPVAAALREAEEEVALPRGAVDVIGLADRYRTVTDYLVTPVVGIIPPGLPLCAAEAEVAAIFEAPLGFVTDPANQRFATVMWRGRAPPHYRIDWDGRRIWGATAAMIVNLSRRLRAG